MAPPFARLPNDILLLIFDHLDAFEDVESFAYCSSRMLNLYLSHRHSIVVRINERLVHPSNMDIAFITFAILRTPLDGIKESVAYLSGIRHDPQIVTRTFLHNFVLQWEFFVLASRINRMCDFFAYPENPEQFWRDLAYEHEACWTGDVLRVGAMTTMRYQACRRKVMAQVWSILDKVRQRVDPPLGAARHLLRDRVAFQRALFQHELSCRATLLQHYDVYAGIWVSDKVPSPGVSHFYEQLCCAFHLAALENSGATEVMMAEMGLQLWPEVHYLGVRIWQDLVVVSREACYYHMIRSIKRLADDVLFLYLPPHVMLPSLWFCNSRKMKPWRLKSLKHLSFSKISHKIGRVFERVDRGSDDESEADPRAPS